MSNVPRLFLRECVMCGQDLAYLATAAPRIWQPERRNETSVLALDRWPATYPKLAWHSKLQSQWHASTTLSSEYPSTPKVKYCPSVRVAGQMRWPGASNREPWELWPTQLWQKSLKMVKVLLSSHPQEIPGVTDSILGPRVVQGARKMERNSWQPSWWNVSCNSDPTWKRGQLAESGRNVTIRRFFNIMASFVVGFPAYPRIPQAWISDFDW